MAHFLIRGEGACRPAFAQIARSSAFCYPPVTIFAAAFRHMLIGTTSRLLMWFFVYISSPKVRAGITVALMSRDAISGLSFLRSGASLYRVVPALAARFSMCRVGRSVLSKKTPTHLCSRLFGMLYSPNCTPGRSAVERSFPQGKWKSSVFARSKFIHPWLASSCSWFPAAVSVMAFPCHDTEIASKQ